MFGIKFYSRTRCLRLEITSSKEHSRRPQFSQQEKLYGMSITLQGTFLLAIFELFRRIVG